MDPNIRTPRGFSPGNLTESRGTSRAEIYLDDETLHRVIESFGPLDYSQFAAAAAFNSHGSYSLGEMAEDTSQGPIGWRPELPWGHETEQKRKSRSPRTEAASPEDARYLLDDEVQREAEEYNTSTAEAKKESLMEWFDRSVEKELQKRRDYGSPTACPTDPALAPMKGKHSLNLSKGTTERLAEASASRVEIAARLQTDFTSELSEAVEKLAKAETMSNYASALRAAEEAALNAPPELMEQAAAAGARRIQTECSHVNETIYDGIRPIEVIGYVGITKPVHPKKP